MSLGSRPNSILGIIATALLLIVSRPAAGDAAGPVPIVEFVLDHGEDLELSPSQVENLGRLDLDVAREMVRRQADLALAYLDLGALVDGDPTKVIDVARTEAKVRDVERQRADLELALVRATEAVKAQLTPEQREKLATLLTDAPTAATDPAGLPVVPSTTRGHAPSGGAGRPGGPGHPGGGAPHAPPSHRPLPYHPSFGGHSHPHVYVGPYWWWNPYWAYPPAPPVIAQAPPVYVEPAPTYWYYCSSLGAYYPYVASCPEPWVQVLARPQ